MRRRIRRSHWRICRIDNQKLVYGPTSENLEPGTHATDEAALDADDAMDDDALLADETDETAEEAATDPELAARGGFDEQTWVSGNPACEPDKRANSPEDAADPEVAAALEAAAGAETVTPTAAHDWIPKAAPAWASAADWSAEQESTSAPRARKIGFPNPKRHSRRWSGGRLRTRCCTPGCCRDTRGSWGRTPAPSRASWCSRWWRMPRAVEQ